MAEKGGNFFRGNGPMGDRGARGQGGDFAGKGQGLQVFDGKRPRKVVQRRTVDYFNACMRYLEARLNVQDPLVEKHFIEPDSNYVRELLPPVGMLGCPVNAVCTRFIHTSINKVRCPIFVCKWTPEGRRLITGAHSGEFTLWNGLTFNFETILQAHGGPVRTMVWSHNDNWMVTGDHAGIIKYWQSNMNNVKEFNAHKEAIREVSFSSTDLKFATCSDDSTIKIWDFARVTEERALMGHGWDVKCVDWHPQKGLLVSGAKDNLIKLWDPKTGNNLQTLYGHKNTVLAAKWNKNGNWLLTGSRDQTINLYDIRMMREVQTYRGHKKEVCSLAWHPVHEALFASGGSEGGILYWNAGEDQQIASIDNAHESNVWSLDWHPLGHILCSGSNDHTTKFWTRNRPGDTMRDKYNALAADGLDVEVASADTNDVEGPMAMPGLDTMKTDYRYGQRLYSDSDRGQFQAEQRNVAEGEAAKTAPPVTNGHSDSNMPLIGQGSAGHEQRPNGPPIMWLAGAMPPPGQSFKPNTPGMMPGHPFVMSMPQNAPGMWPPVTGRDGQPLMQPPMQQSMQSSMQSSMQQSMQSSMPSSMQQSMQSSMQSSMQQSMQPPVMGMMGGMPMPLGPPPVPMPGGKPMQMMIPPQQGPHSMMKMPPQMPMMGMMPAGMWPGPPLPPMAAAAGNQAQPTASNGQGQNMDYLNSNQR